MQYCTLFAIATPEIFVVIITHVQTDKTVFIGSPSIHDMCMLLTDLLAFNICMYTRHCAIRIRTVYYHTCNRSGLGLLIEGKSAITDEREDVKYEYSYSLYRVNFPEAAHENQAHSNR